jgi:hypothetical protein
VADPRDRRQLHWSLSSEGHTLPRALESAAIAQLKAALGELRAHEIENNEDLLSAIVGQRVPSLLSPNGRSLTLTRLTTAQGRAAGSRCDTLRGALKHRHRRAPAAQPHNKVAAASCRFRESLGAAEPLEAAASLDALTLP